MSTGQICKPKLNNLFFCFNCKKMKTKTHIKKCKKRKKEDRMVMVRESAKIYIGRHRSGQSSGDIDLTFDKEWYEHLSKCDQEDVIYFLRRALEIAKKNSYLHKIK